MLYLRYCQQNPLHYVASKDSTFNKLGSRKCPFCHAPFGEEIKEVRDFGTPTFISENEATKKALEGIDISFGILVKDDPTLSFNGMDDIA